VVEAGAQFDRPRRDQASSSVRTERPANVGACRHGFDVTDGSASTHTNQVMANRRHSAVTSSCRRRMAAPQCGDRDNLGRRRGKATGSAAHGAALAGGVAHAGRAAGLNVSGWTRNLPRGSHRARLSTSCPAAGAGRPTAGRTFDADLPPPAARPAPTRPGRTACSHSCKPSTPLRPLDAARPLGSGS